MTQQDIVVVNGATSSSTIVTSGVPHGTVLGSLLFLLSINDLPTAYQTTYPQVYGSLQMIALNDSRTIYLIKSQKWQDTRLMKL